MKIICNPATYGGKARKAWPKVVRALKESGLDFEVEWTKERNDAIRIVKESIDDHDVMVAYGGDGTINEILTGIGQTGFKTTLGIIPSGRGNDNAFNVRQTNKIEDIIEMLIEKKHRLVDCMEIDNGDRYCMGIAGAGIDGYLAEIVYGKSTRIIYNIGLVRSILTYRPRHIRVDIDDGRVVRDGKCLSVMLANGQRAGSGKMIAPNAIIDDGLLEVVIIGNTRILESLITSTKLGKGTHITHPKCEIIRGKKIVLSTNSEKKVHAHAMGELLGELPHTFVCLQKKLKVLRMSDEILRREGWHNTVTFSDNTER